MIDKFFIGGKLPVFMKGKDYFKTTTVEDKNDLGNGWTDGCSSFKELWEETEDAEFEVIPPLMISDKNVQEGDAREVDSSTKAG